MTSLMSAQGLVTYSLPEPVKPSIDARLDDKGKEARPKRNDGATPEAASFLAWLVQLLERSRVSNR